MENLDDNKKEYQDEPIAKKRIGGLTQGKYFLAGMIVLTIVVSSVFGSFFGFVAGVGSNSFFSKISDKLFHVSSNNQSNVQVSREKIVEEDSAVIDVVNNASPAVVSIVISKDVPKVQDFFSNPFDFPNFFDPFGGGSGSSGSTTTPQSQNDPGSNQGAAQKETIGGGSGFLITSDGMIVTNKHVVSDTSADYTVITSDDQEHPAKVLAIDPTNDIAIIKIDGNDYPTLSFGDSDSLKIGQTVIAIGNSLGEFSNTVSKGIISGLKRNLTAGGGIGSSDTENLSNIVQTDAAINPGNSGGPLLDINGQVIGVNVAMAQGAQNIGFALPSKQIEKVVEEVKTTGKISVPYIGIRYIPVDTALQKQISLPYSYGALVVRGDAITDFAVIPGSPADKAGIVENDVILEINGTKIDKENSLSDLISKYKKGDTISLKIWHKGQEESLNVTLEERAQ
ncbi:MAG: PDZ domain-containing protein [Candidatus Moranbacteria bacterium]|nr:PDZ domain-containing protein [Candidatus Moranbacteria bacterium]